MKMKKGRLSGLGAGVIVSLCFSFIAFVYAPLELYLTNVSEFWMKISDFAIPVLVLFGVSFLFCTAALAAARLINGNLYNFCLIIGASATVSTYIQGNFLIKNLPDTNGAKVDWGAYPAERLKSILAFVIPLCILVFVLIKFREKILRKAASVVSGCLAVLLAVTLVSLTLTTDITKNDAVFPSVKDEFLMSENENMVILILDALDNATFNKAIEKDKELMQELDGFTFYDNTLAAYPYTSHSIPLMFSGEWFENQLPFSSYLSDSMIKSPVFKSLKDKGYCIGLYDTDNFGFSIEDADSIFDNYYERHLSYLTHEIYEIAFRMACVKYAPWDLKRFGWGVFRFVNRIETVEEEYGEFLWDNTDFYSAIEKDEPITLTDKKCARIYHLDGAHVPFEYDADFNPVDNGTYEGKVDACIKLLKLYIKRLKESGVYDNTAVVVLGDHGYAGNDERDEANVVKRFSVGLMAKGMNESHPYAVSSAPVSYIDISDAFIRLSDGKKSGEIFDVKDGESRTRRMLLFEYLKEDYIKEYITGGTAQDYKSYVATGKEYNAK